MNELQSRCAVIVRHQLFLTSEVFVTEQARSLQRFRPLLLGRVLAGKPRDALSYRVPVHPATSKLLRYMLFQDPRLLLPLLHGYEPALIHAHFGVEGVYAMNLSRRLKVPLVTTFHGYDATMNTRRLLTSRKLSWLMYALKRRQLARYGSLFICVSQFIRERVLALGFPEEITRLHYIGVDTQAFPVNAEDPAHPVILHVARLVEKKGTFYLIKAFASIAGRFPLARLTIIGEGPLKEELSTLAAESGIAAQIDWLGAKTHAEVKSWMRRASIFCLPSCTAVNGDSEGLSIVVLEAGAAGLPTVSTLHAGIPEAVIDGQTGYLVPERDIARLSEALEALLASYDLRRRFGEQARQFIRTKFDLVNQTRLLEQHYDSVL